MIRHHLSMRVWSLLAIAILGAVAWLGLHGVAASAPPAANADVGGPRIVAAGTAKFLMGAQQDNATFTHVKLAADVAAKLGDDYIVMVSSRFPNGGYPFFTPLWKPAKEGFDVTMVDVTLGPNSTESLAFNPNKTFLVDWIVVKK
jgi:hypothetical protein